MKNSLYICEIKGVKHVPVPVFHVMVHFELYSDISGISQGVLTLRQYFSGKIRYCSALTMGDFRAYEYKKK